MPILAAMWRVFNTFPDCHEPYEWSTLKFSAENGREHPGRVFRDVRVREYRTTIPVPEPAPLVQYTLSGYDGGVRPDLSSRRQEIEGHFLRSVASWPLVLRSTSVAFLCRNPYADD